MSVEIKQLNSLDVDFWEQMEKLLAWEAVSDNQVFNTVSEIIDSVRQYGDSAVIELTQRFDGLHAEDMTDLEMPT
ncbi:MAG: histidinol dehydrogenase, partial [Gammaproteobacteria bacterium]|nr:histidinol dehydrogenase [Gammaproteobacteria bacterium]